MGEKVLIVDDDPEVLESFRRYYYKSLDLDTASGGEEGLKKLKQELFVVVISDFMMPKMDGVRFLTLAREISPETTRIMLTGNAGINLAIDAVNEGHIYRFLTKPVHPDILTRAIQAGIDYHRLLTSERDLLEKTLNGSISLLVEILGLVNPAAFSRAIRIKNLVNALVAQLRVTPAWFYELAAALSQIGFVTLPPDMLEAIYLHKNLTVQEAAMFREHPHVARKLIERIPRLELIGQLIENQQKPYFAYTGNPNDTLSTDPVVLGAQILKAAIDYDNLAEDDLHHFDIIRTMEKRVGLYHPQIIANLSELHAGDPTKDRRKIMLNELEIGMVVDEDLFTIDRTLIMQRGQEVTETVVTRLNNINNHSKINEPIQVLVDRK